jgi:hypothetical protein
MNTIMPILAIACVVGVTFAIAWSRPRHRKIYKLGDFDGYEVVGVVELLDPAQADDGHDQDATPHGNGDRRPTTAFKPGDRVFWTRPGSGPVFTGTVEFVVDIGTGPTARIQTDPYRGAPMGATAMACRHLTLIPEGGVQ